MPKKQTHPPEKESTAFKNIFGKKLLLRLSDALEDVYPDFDQKAFLGLLPKLESLEMKPRVQLIREELRKQLPKSYPKAMQILFQSVKKQTLDGFDLWPYSDFVQTYGLENVDLSLEALKKLTPLFTSEFAIRPFLKSYPSQTLKYLENCALDQDVHVRRWASEGTRPRLPWGERLHEFIQKPSQTLKILETLKFDPELYVRKSVSNHLNDIAKDHPEQVIQILTRWKKQAGKEHGAKVDWIINRALRTLIKNGHPEALRLIGVPFDVEIKLSDFKINQQKFKLGEKLELEFKLKSLSKTPQNLVIDYIIHYVRANQNRSPKVFKLKKTTLPGMGEMRIVKAHHLRKVTTRAHYAGLHFIELQINGRILGRIEWELKI